MFNRKTREAETRQIPLQVFDLVTGGTDAQVSALRSAILSISPDADVSSAKRISNWLIHNVHGLGNVDPTIGASGGTHLGVGFETIAFEDVMRMLGSLGNAAAC